MIFKILPTLISEREALVDGLEGFDELVEPETTLLVEGALSGLLEGALLPVGVLPVGAPLGPSCLEIMLLSEIVTVWFFPFSFRVIALGGVPFVPDDVVDEVILDDAEEAVTVPNANVTFLLLIAVTFPYIVVCVEVALTRVPTLIALVIKIAANATAKNFFMTNFAPIQFFY